MHAAPVTVCGVPSPTLSFGLSAVLAVVCVLALVVGAACTGPGTQQQQAVQQQKTTPEADIKALRQKAEAGDADAQYRVGFMYSQGNGVPQDYEQAVAWYRKAAEQGHAEAQGSLGSMYISGHGVPQDPALAVAWTRKAAEQGDGFEQFLLGGWYYVGVGVPQDYIEAHKWVNLAAARTSGELQRRYSEWRDAIAKEMTPAQLAEAQKRASEWTAAFEARKR
jgi:TPR repeat protein